MQTFNTIYRGKENLRNFIRKNEIYKEKNVLVQAFCGLTDKEIILELRNTICELTPEARIVGTTSDSVIYEGKSMQGVCIISFTIFEHTTITTSCMDNVNLDSYALGKNLVKEIIKSNSKALIMFATSQDINGEEFLDGADSISKGIVKAGGLSGKVRDADDIVFTENKISFNGAVGVSLNSEELYIYTDYNFDWVPIGKEHTVTYADKNIVYTIDNIPAVDVYKRYLGEEVIDGLPESGVEYPLMLLKNDRYISRVVSKHCENGAVICNATVAEGEKVWFGYGNLNNILESSKRMFKRITNQPIESLFIYSCAARLRFLRLLANCEMEPLNYDISVSGFFTYGEFNYSGNISQFVSQNMAVIAISESSRARIIVDDSKFFRYYDNNIKTDKALYNLIKATTDELNQLNMSLEELVEEKTYELKNQFYVDSLTRLPNRIKLLEDIDELKLNKIAIVNIDGFREINDFFGNKVGDAILLELGRRLKEFGDENGLKVYRLPSDEFGLLADAAISSSQFISNIEILPHKIKKEYFYYHNHELLINVSIGMVLGENSLIEKANMALNWAKKNKESIKVYNDDIFLLQGYENNLMWSKKLSKAIEDGRIVTFFQPIYNNCTNKIEKYESLIRMIDEDNKVISPMSFLDVSKRTRLYPQLTKIVVNRTFEVFHETDYEFSVNLSVQDVMDEEIRKLIRERLSYKGVACRAVFEIVESEGIENYKEVVDFINEIHQYGAKVAIDDFGTGYSNFEYLLRLNVDYIKIDGSMIKNIDKDVSAQLVTEAIVNFASKLEIKVIAEFVHSESVYNKVKQMGIEFSQGYYFGQPKPNLLGDTRDAEHMK
ncbi:MAG: EAL domain-containing protein [Bacillota bacterium]|nr:EAL domain-containing protein [Bacillota bacterium]